MHKNGTVVEPVCGRCRHWHKNPPDPNNLSNQSGLCKQGPPHCTLIATQQGIVPMTGYPQVPPNFPACAQFLTVPVTLSE